MAILGVLKFSSSSPDHFSAQVIVSNCFWDLNPYPRSCETSFLAIQSMISGVCLLLNIYLLFKYWWLWSIAVSDPPHSWFYFRCLASKDELSQVIQITESTCYTSVTRFECVVFLPDFYKTATNFCRNMQGVKSISQHGTAKRNLSAAICMIFFSVSWRAFLMVLTIYIIFVRVSMMPCDKWCLFCFKSSGYFSSSFCFNSWISTCNL